MSIHDRLPNEHFVETTHTYYARCSCGWSSGPYARESGADAAFAQHSRIHVTVVEG